MSYNPIRGFGEHKVTSIPGREKCSISLWFGVTGSGTATRNDTRAVYKNGPRTRESKGLHPSEQGPLRETVSGWHSLAQDGWTCVYKKMDVIDQIILETILSVILL